MKSVDIVQADLDRADHQRAIVELVNAYAMDIMGNGEPLPEQVQREMIPGLRSHPTTITFLAYDGAAAVGVAVCFLGFSTFAAKSVVNIHDLAVVPTHRGCGIGRALLEAVERKARELGCCKITLEVSDLNHRAKRVYKSAGFRHAMYVEGTGGGALFLSKPL
jgi:GNAT superfamily N-acetyltransferase